MHVPNVAGGSKEKERVARHLARHLMGGTSDDDSETEGMEEDSVGDGRRKSSRPASEKLREETDIILKELDLDASAVLRPLVPFEEFCNESLCDVIEMDKDFVNMKVSLLSGWLVCQGRHQGGKSVREKSLSSIFQYGTILFQKLSK